MAYQTRLTRAVRSLILAAIALPVPCAFYLGGEFRRLQTPPLLSYAELVELGTIDEISPVLKTKLDNLLTTPFVSN